MLRNFAQSWQRDRAVELDAAQRTGLGVGALPERMEQLPHGVPTALVARDARSAALWGPALLTDALAVNPVFLLVSSAECADFLLTHAPLHEARTQGRLVIWTMAAGLHPRLREFALRPLFDELESAGLRPHHALVVMDARLLLMNLEVPQLQRVGEQLRVWSLRRKRPVVLAFFTGVEAQQERSASAYVDVLPMLMGMCNSTMHIASLSTTADFTTLRLERWNSQAGAIFQTGLGLTLDPDTHRFHHDGSRTQGDGHTLIEAPDQRKVIATRAAVSQQRGVLPHWHIVETLEELALAAAHSIGATLLIDAGNSIEFEETARLVHRLRLAHPPTLKIVVRENTDKLRSSSEQALLQLGANAIVYRELGFSRLLQLLEDIRHQSFVRPVSADCQQTLDAFMPASSHGYQTPAEFSRLVRKMLAHAQETGQNHSMVRLDLAPQISHVIALRTCNMSREGDLITAGRSAVYVFLFACREPDIEPALKRLFVVPLAQLFTAQSADCTHAGMMALLEGVDRDARHGVPDYTQLLVAALRAVAGAAGAPADTCPTAGASASDRSREIIRAPAPVGSVEELAHQQAQTIAPAERPSMHAQPIGQRQPDAHHAVQTAITS